MAAEATVLGVAHFLFDDSEIVTQAGGGKERGLKENPLPYGGVKKKKQVECGREKGMEKKRDRRTRRIQDGTREWMFLGGCTH